MNQDQDHQDSDMTGGTDTPTTEWLGQSVDSDTELAERLSEDHDEAEAEKLFDQQSTGADVEASRRGDHIDPDLGEAAYRDEHPDHAADPD